MVYYQLGDNKDHAVSEAMSGALEGLLDRNLSLDRQELFRSFSALQQPKNVKNILRGICLNEIRCDGFKHPNGFKKIRLFKSTEFSLRIHIWETRTEPSLPHNHRRCFYSKVLTGQIVARTFEEAEQGQNCQRQICHHIQDTGYELRVDAKSKLAQRSIFRMKAGHFYYVDSQELHSIEKDTNEFTATLVIEGRVVSNSSVTYSPPCAVAREHVSQYPMTSSEIIDAAKSLLLKV